MCKFLIKLPLDIKQYILSYLKDGIDIYLYHVSITKKILKSIYNNNNHEFLSNNISTAVNLILNKDTDYDTDYDTEYNADYDVKDTGKTHKLSKFEYTEQKNKKRFDKNIMLKKQENRMKTLRNKYSTQFKEFKHLETKYMKDIDYVHKRYKITDWIEQWEYIDSGNWSCDSHGAYSYDDLYERYYVYKYDSSIIICDGMSYEKYQTPKYNYLEYLNKIGHYGNEVEYIND